MNRWTENLPDEYCVWSGVGGTVPSTGSSILQGHGKTLSVGLGVGTKTKLEKQAEENQMVQG